MIELRDVRFAWPRASSDCIAIDALDIGAGETLFLHGASGCGKSTLLSLMAGVLTARSGTVTLAGRSWAGMSGSARDAWRAEHVGYLFQQFNLLPWLSVLDNVLLGCRFSRGRAQRASQRGGTPAAQARTLLQHVGIPDDAWPRAARELSVGQQQRVAAARALIGAPPVVIADEPTSALDSALRDGFMDLLLRECRDTGSTLVFVSHDERLAARFDRTLSLPALNRAMQEVVA
ncbi:MAG: ABC transporter ATP-binding protein [Piscinibacter sp.]